ncbi:MAG: hypothetical protein ABGZ17_15525, partial [Planctomycetaceae bacterium]
MATLGRVNPPVQPQTASPNQIQNPPPTLWPGGFRSQFLLVVARFVPSWPTSVFDDGPDFSDRRSAGVRMVVGAIGLLCLVFGCSPTETEGPSPSAADMPVMPDVPPPKPLPTITTAARFREMTANSGVNFRYANGQDAEHFTIVESLGGGAALLDYDADG